MQSVVRQYGKYILLFRLNFSYTVYYLTGTVCFLIIPIGSFEWDNTRHCRGSGVSAWRTKRAQNFIFPKPFLIIRWTIVFEISGFTVGRQPAASALTFVLNSCDVRATISVRFRCARSSCLSSDRRQTRLPRAAGSKLILPSEYSNTAHSPSPLSNNVRNVSLFPNSKSEFHRNSLFEFRFLIYVKYDLLRALDSVIHFTCATRRLRP